MGRGKGEEEGAAANSRSKRPDNRKRLGEIMRRNDLFCDLLEECPDEAFYYAREDIFNMKDVDPSETLFYLVYDRLEKEYSYLHPYKVSDSWSAYQDRRAAWVNRYLRGVEMEELAWQLRFEKSDAPEPGPEEEVDWNAEEVKGPRRRDGRQLIYGRSPSAVSAARARQEGAEGLRRVNELKDQWEELEISEQVKEDYRSRGASIAACQRWHYLFGFNGAEWQEWGSRPSGRLSGHDIYLSPRHAAAWIWAGCSFDEGREYSARGFTPYDIAAQKGYTE